MERLDTLLSEHWSPWMPMLRLTEEVALRIPPVDVYEEGDTIIVKAELPGMKKEEIALHVTNDLLTIAGKKTKEEKVERKDYLKVERAAGEFTRTVKLPATVLADRVTAAYRDGVLEIRAPKAEPAKPAGRKVEVS
jgi:HSP20 family protein